MKQLHILSIFCFLFAGLCIDANAQITIPRACPNGEYKIIRDDGSIYCSPTLCPGQAPIIFEDGIIYCAGSVGNNCDGFNAPIDGNPCRLSPCPPGSPILQFSCDWNGQIGPLCEYDCIPNINSFCPTGRGADGSFGFPNCVPCEKGTSSYPRTKDRGSFKCFPCQEGMFQDEEEQANCKSCPEGTYQDEKGAVICKSCPEGYTTLMPGADNISLCVPVIPTMPQWALMILGLVMMSLAVLRIRRTALA